MSIELQVVIWAGETGKRDGVLRARDHMASPWMGLGLDNGDLPVKIVPVVALESLVDNSRRNKYEKQFGGLNEIEWLGLAGAFKLYESVRTGSTAFLRDAGLLFDSAILLVSRQSTTSNEPNPVENRMKEGAAAITRIFTERGPEEGLTWYLTSALATDGSFRDFDVLYNERAKTVQPVIFCGDFAEALKVHLWLNMFRASTVATCLRCSTRYIRKKTTDLYCSKRCGTYVRQGRFQEKKRNAKSRELRKGRG